MGAYPEGGLFETSGHREKLIQMPYGHRRRCCACPSSGPVALPGSSASHLRRALAAKGLGHLGPSATLGLSPLGFAGPQALVHWVLWSGKREGRGLGEQGGRCPPPSHPRPAVGEAWILGFASEGAGVNGCRVALGHCSSLPWHWEEGGGMFQPLPGRTGAGTFLQNLLLRPGSARQCPWLSEVPVATFTVHMQVQGRTLWLLPDGTRIWSCPPSRIALPLCDYVDLYLLSMETLEKARLRTMCPG